MTQKRGGGTMVVMDATEDQLGLPASAAAKPGPPAVSPTQTVPVGPDAGVMAIMATTRAMRHLAPDPVAYELLRTVIEAATWAPSGGNKQVARYVLVTDRDVIAQLAPLWRQVIEDYRLILEAGGVWILAPRLPETEGLAPTDE